MIDKIILSRDRTRATIYFTNKGPIDLYSDSGQVLVLVDFFTAPIGYSSRILYNRRLETAMEKTVDIDLELLNKVS